MTIQAALVASPKGSGLVVSQVILDAGKTVWMLGAEGPKLAPKRAYESLFDAVEQNSRATTTCLVLAFTDDAAALAMLGKAPPSA